ncbi:hypothetical protein CDD83_2449 [Cordyceps sp. RAO-2017]|nr:hypothetical protein CDD83_2449 [Cordyceps sp. RAO-2017]
MRRQSWPSRRGEPGAKLPASDSGVIIDTGLGAADMAFIEEARQGRPCSWPRPGVGLAPSAAETDEERRAGRSVGKQRTISTETLQAVRLPRKVWAKRQGTRRVEEGEEGGEEECEDEQQDEGRQEERG